MRGPVYEQKSILLGVNLPGEAFLSSQKFTKQKNAIKRGNHYFLLFIIQGTHKVRVHFEKSTTPPAIATEIICKKD